MQRKLRNRKDAEPNAAIHHNEDLIEANLTESTKQTPRKGGKRKSGETSEAMMSRKRIKEKKEQHLESLETVQFQEDDQVVEMTVEGQESEFASEVESSEEDEDDEVILNLSQGSEKSINIVPVMSRPLSMETNICSDQSMQDLTSLWKKNRTSLGKR